MVNYLFIFMFVVGMLYSIMMGRIDEVSKAILSTPNEAINIFIGLSAVLIFWSGILEIVIKSGLINSMTKVVKKIIHPFFKGLDKNSKALDYISMNFTANFLGVGSAATPFGLKAMKELDELNNHSKVASKEMITLIVINTSGLCVIPTTILALREAYQSQNASIIMPYLICVTILTTLFSISINEVCKRVF